MLLRRKRGRSGTRSVAIGVSDRDRVWAISVDDADPLVIGGIDDAVSRLVVDAANTLELPSWALRMGFVWNAGNRPMQSRTIPPNEFREIHSGETAKTGDSLHLMGVACQKLEEARGLPAQPD